MLSDDKEFFSQLSINEAANSSSVDKGFGNLLRKIFPGIDYFQLDQLEKSQEPAQYPTFNLGFLQSSSTKSGAIPASINSSIDQSFSNYARNPMTKIRVDPPVLQNCSQNIQTSSATLKSVGGNLASCASGVPSYDGQFGPQVRAIAFDASSQSAQLSDKFTTLAAWLSNKAKQFLDADNLYAGILGYQYNNLSWMSPLLGFFSQFNSFPFQFLVGRFSPGGINLWNPVNGNITVPNTTIISLNLLALVNKYPDIKDLGKIILLAKTLHNGTSYTDELILRAPTWSRDLYDLHFTNKAITSFISKEASNMNSIGWETGIFTFTKLIEDWTEDKQKYGFLTPKFNAAFSVDAFKAAISVEAGLVGLTVGAAVGMFTGPAGAAVGAVIGAFSAQQVVDYVMKTPVTTLLPQVGSVVEAAVPGILPGLIPVLDLYKNKHLGQQFGTKVAEWISSPTGTNITCEEFATDNLAKAENAAGQAIIDIGNFIQNIAVKNKWL